tara:strand:+ start:2194 stop:3729 length:1536 start_codon:yes stop_codon:yes gene_type:complete
MYDDLTPEQMRRIAASLSDMGRKGDTQLVHVNKKEVELLKTLGSGTKNPNTGLLEFYQEDDEDNGGGYTSFADMFDGGGPGQSGDTYDNDNDPNNEVTGIARVSNRMAGAGHANNGLNDDDSRNDDKDYTYDSFADMFDGGGIGMSGDTYGHGDFSNLDKDGDGHISRAESGKGLPGGIDGDNDSPFKMVANVVGLVASPVAYLGAKAANSYFDKDGDGSMFTTGGKFTLFGDGTNTTTGKAKAITTTGSSNRNNNESTQSTSDGEVDQTGAEGEESTYSQISDSVQYRPTAFSSRPERRKFINYDYSDGTGKPVGTYNGNAKPFHVATSQDSIDAYYVSETTSNAIDSMISAMPTEIQDQLSGEISVQLTADNKLALFVGNDDSGYIEATYAADDAGMETAMKDVANMLSYGEASGDLKIDAGYTGRVRSAQRFQGYSDQDLSNQLALLKNEGATYQKDDPLYLLYLERLQELEDEIARRMGDAKTTTAQYSVDGVTRSVQENAQQMFQV